MAVLLLLCNLCRKRQIYFCCKGKPSKKRIMFFQFQFCQRERKKFDLWMGQICGQKLNQKMFWNNLAQCGGCGSVGRVVASDTRGPRFVHNFFKLTYLMLGNYRKDEIKKKRPEMANLKNNLARGRSIENINVVTWPGPCPIKNIFLQIYARILLSILIGFSKFQTNQIGFKRAKHKLLNTYLSQICLKSSDHHLPVMENLL